MQHRHTMSHSSQPSDAQAIAEDLIPVVDISTLRNGQNAQHVAAQLHAASQSLGFIYIKGHGIPASVIQAARTDAYTFFRSPDSVKSQVLVSRSHRGWLRPGASRMRDDVPVDLKESFIWGHEDSDANGEPDHPLRGPNQWPASAPHMQSSATEFFVHAHQVAHQLMRGFALGLDLPEDFFLRTCTRPISRASYVYYPPQNAEAPEQFGVGPHTDFGVLTVLCQDDVGGLQVQNINGQWLHAPPIADTLIVNVGDLLARWTDGAYKSTPHRVVNTSGRERLSLVLAFDPDPQTLIDAREVFGQDYQPAEDPITCGDYLQWRFSKAFSYREKNDATNINSQELS